MTGQSLFFDYESVFSFIKSMYFVKNSRGGVCHS